MEELWFYVKFGFNHVMNLGAYDHILFLCALAIPFTFKNWKKVIVLATIFTIAHCMSLALSVYDVLVVDAELVEFIIPITIALTAIFNIICIKTNSIFIGMYLHVLATSFFGLIHGFGFSNYFKMLMAEKEEKLSPLIGFAGGIEISQLLIILTVLALAVYLPVVLKIKQAIFIVITSMIIILITIPMLINTFPW